ncbi:MAG: hypothetical protein M3128_01305 [Verrucomicrobiota bacterium]|nr:hypothetical protein [Verrucomicrobiota bacterium]
MRKLVQRAAQSAVGWGLFAIALRFGSALLLLPLILRRLPPDELGLWYIFVSLGALALLVDLGFAPTIVRAAGYLWAGSRTLLPFGISLEEIENKPPRLPNLHLLADLVASVRVYYLTLAGVLFLLLSGAGGAWVWHKSAGLTNANSIRAAFLVYAFGLSLGFAHNLWPSLLSGINAVRQVQQITAACLFAQVCLTAAGLVFGWKLWALVVGAVFAYVAERITARIVFRQLSPLRHAKFDFSIIAVLWPNAWRSAAVGLGAYMILQASTLICSAFLDLRTTASYGLSLQAVTLLVGLSSIWVIAKMPTIYHLRAQGSLAQIARIFRQRISLALVTFVVGAIVLLSLGQNLLHHLHAQTLLLPRALLALLLIIQLLEMHHGLYGELVYSENVNPFVRPALISGATIVILSLVFAPRFGLWGMLLATGAVQLCFNNWWPVRRAIRGLGPVGRNYWRGFIFAPPSSARADTSL